MTGGRPTRPPSRLALLAAGPALAALAAAATWSVRAGLADFLVHQRTIAATERAIRLAPDNAEYLTQLSDLMTDDSPKGARDALLRAVRLDPWDARSWIGLGLRAESEGDAASAMQFLLRAADVDKEYLPRWTLANYFLRHQDEERFWFWAKEAVAMSPDDPRPLFRLCGRVREDGGLIQRLRIRNPDLHAAYLWYLLDARRPDLIGPTVQQVFENNREADLHVLLSACESMLAAARSEEASGVWTRLAQAGRVPHASDGDNHDQLLVNGRFRSPPISRGFDWILPKTEGLSASLEGASQGLRVTFSGSEPEDAEALAQLVPVRAGERYELQFAYRTGGIPRDAGLVWLIMAANGALLRQSSSLASEQESEGRLQFETPVDCRLVRLSLWYRRALGTTRLEGDVVLRSVALRRLP